MPPPPTLRVSNELEAPCPLGLLGKLPRGKAFRILKTRLPGGGRAEEMGQPKRRCKWEGTLGRVGQGTEQEIREKLGGAAEGGQGSPHSEVRGAQLWTSNVGHRTVN